MLKRVILRAESRSLKFKFSINSNSIIMLILLGFAFLSGLVTILAPCIWPLLPIILSTTIGSKGHRKPLGITLGIMVSFTIFTLFISTIINLFHLDPNALRLFAVVVLVILGLVMIIPALNRLLELGISRLSSKFGGTQQQGGGLVSGFATGLTLGIVWSPCAGPILAAIATLAATGKVTSSVLLVTIAYVTGIGIPLFFFAYGGATLVNKSRSLSRYTGRIQQVFGILMLLTALAIYTNYDKYLQAQLLNMFPQFSSSLNSFESNSAVKQQLDVLKGATPKETSQTADNSDLFNENKQAPDFAGITKWLNPNDKPLTINDLKGKVVLVDFWTYTCINCIRTLPFVTSWYDKYKDRGFVVIGVHTPEFAFEKETSNVEMAIKQYNIHYPVAQDNNYKTWESFSNDAWPAEYLIDATGIIRRVHKGEGEYDRTEKAIQTLLKEKGAQVSSNLVNVADQTPGNFDQSPETYLGSSRMQYLYPNGSVSNGEQTFTAGANLPVNTFSFGGMWTIADQYSMTGKNATLLYHFNADKVHLVMRPGNGNKQALVKVFLDGKAVDSSHAGGDVQNGIVTVDQDRLYTLIDLYNNPGEHVLKLEFQTPGTEVYAFTFG